MDGDRSADYPLGQNIHAVLHADPECKRRDAGLGSALPQYFCDLGDLCGCSSSISAMR
jgi:hypothetical protein